MEKERDWIDEEKRLTAIYVRRGYSKTVAESMAEQEIVKRKNEYGYSVYVPEKEDKEVSGNVKSKIVKMQKKGAKK